jgi:hypothetical protein
LSLEDQLAQEDLLRRLREKKKRKMKDSHAGDQDADSDDELDEFGFRATKSVTDQVYDALKEIAAMHLGVTKKTLDGYTVEEMQQKLREAGLDGDLMELLKDMSEKDAARALAMNLAKAEAESALLDKLLDRSNLSKQQRADLEKRKAKVDQTIGLYKDLLATMLAGETMKFDEMGEEERLAMQRMLDKMDQRKKNLKDSQKGEEDDTDIAMMFADSQVSDHVADAIKEIAGKNGMADLIQLAEAMTQMSEIDAAKEMALRMAQNEEEAMEIRRQLARKDLPQYKRVELENRQAQLDKEFTALRDMLATLQAGQKATFEQLSQADQDALNELLNKLAAKRHMKKKDEMARQQFSTDFDIDEMYDLLTHYDTKPLDVGQLKNIHEQLHQCQCSLDCIGVVLMAHDFTISRDRFLEILQGLHVTCRRDTAVTWDMRGQDHGMFGSLSRFGAQLIYNMNNQDVGESDYNKFYNETVSLGNFSEIGYMDLYGALVTDPALGMYITES